MVRKSSQEVFKQTLPSVVRQNHQGIFVQKQSTPLSGDYLGVLDFRAFRKKREDHSNPQIGWASLVDEKFLGFRVVYKIIVNLKPFDNLSKRDIKNIK